MLKETTGNINRIVTILGMNDKNLLRLECCNELLAQTKSLCKQVKANHGDMKAMQQMKDDVSAFSDNSHFSISKIQNDFKDVLYSLSPKDSKNKSQLTINNLIQQLQK